MASNISIARIRVARFGYLAAQIELKAGNKRVADSSSTKDSQRFIRPHNETLSVAMSVRNPDRSPFAIDG
jgi:hypothetical protein